MYFQQALVIAMGDKNVTINELAKRTNSDPRWIECIATNLEWRPRLDTILRLCYALGFNVFTFLEIAETGLQNNPQPLKTTSYDVISPSSVHFQQILDLRPCHIAKALRSFRLECGFSQRGLEKLTPFNVHSICMRESERYQNYPTVITLYSYCDAYQITLNEFVRRAFFFLELE